MQKALAGHLCRCTGYHRIVDAIQLAGSGATLPAVAPKHGIGGASPRYRGHDQVLGTKTFVADMTVDGMLHGALVLSDHPRATVLGIDIRPAEAATGVVHVITADDTPGQRHHGLIVKDWPLLVAPGEETRYIGDVLAVVVADTQHHARRAAANVAVRYKVLAPVTDPESALLPDTPRVHDGGNLLEVCAFQRGDVEQALASFGPHR